MQKFEPLIPGQFYHIYNRGMNGEPLFKSDKNYWYFLSKYAEHTFPVVETFAYSLLSNHFHLLVRVRDEVLREGSESIGNSSNYTSRQFSNFFNSYTQSINKIYERSGGLFESTFRRKRIDKTGYLRNVINYIHFNPQHHKMIEDYREWPYTSYQSYRSKSSTKLSREEGLSILNNNLEVSAESISPFIFPDLTNYILNFEELTN
jgi:REP element-mobilizing transposase RayT